MPISSVAISPSGTYKSINHFAIFPDNKFAIGKIDYYFLLSIITKLLYLLNRNLYCIWTIRIDIHKN